MEGLGLLITGAFASMALCLVAIVISQLRRYALGALAAPFITSVVLVFGGFILLDMNPAREYGAAYVPTGKEHDPSKMDYFVLWLAAGTVFFAVGWLGTFIQKHLVEALIQQVSRWRNRRSK